MRPRLLIADDAAVLRQVLSVLLVRHGYEVAEALDGPTALALLRATPRAFSGAILDVKMPGATGIDVLRALREDPTTAHLPVVMLTSDQSPDTHLAALAAGWEPGHLAWVNKPAGSAEVLEALASVGVVAG